MATPFSLVSCPHPHPTPLTDVIKHQRRIIKLACVCVCVSWLTLQPLTCSDEGDNSLYHIQLKCLTFADINCDDLPLFSFLWHWKFKILEFWSVGQTKRHESFILSTVGHFKKKICFLIFNRLNTTFEYLQRKATFGVIKVKNCLKKQIHDKDNVRHTQNKRV